jgi:ribose-phosphate pyrophosphokinase
MDKRRSAGVVSGELLVGDVRGATVLVVDDIIASGGTMARAATSSLQNGAREVIALAAHGLFTGDAQNTLLTAPLSQIITTDTVPSFRLEAGFAISHVRTVSASPLFASCIDCLHKGGSVAQLLGDVDYGS